jgi:hypothetical protein
MFSWIVNVPFVASTRCTTLRTDEWPTTADWRGTATDIRYGPTTDYGSTATAHTPSPLPFSSAGPFREVDLTGLTTGTTYHYSIGGGADATFNTAPTGSYTFDVIADVGAASHYPALPAVHGQVAADNPAFVLVPGDITYADPNGQSVVDEHFNDVMTWRPDRAYMPAWGNHEWQTPTSDDLRNYKGRFEIPNAGTSPDAPSAGCCGGGLGLVRRRTCALHLVPRQVLEHHVADLADRSTRSSPQPRTIRRSSSSSRSGTGRRTPPDCTRVTSRSRTPSATSAIGTRSTY